MMQDGLISIIVPVYNASAYIRDTIRMVTEQTYRNWELILVDDCSKDDSRQVLKACVEDYIGQGLDESKFRLIYKEQNEGAARARNTGIDASAGRYIAFLDADDIWRKDKLEKELAFLLEKGAGFAFTSYEFGDENAKGTGKIVHAPEALTYREALSRTVIFTSTVLLDTQVIDKAFIQMPVVKSEDTALWWKLLKAGHTAYGLDKVLVIYRRPGKSLSSNKFEAMKRIWNLYRKQERLSVWESAYYFVFWALRATLRRI